MRERRQHSMSTLPTQLDAGGDLPGRPTTDFETFKSRTKKLMIGISSSRGFMKSLTGGIKEVESILLKGMLASLGSN